MVILALLPILFLIVALGFLKMAGWKACPIAAIIAFVVAVFCYNMSVPIAISAALEGVALACWPILLVIIMALFAYKLTVATGSLEVIKQMLTTVSEDKRVVFLLMASGRSWKAWQVLVLLLLSRLLCWLPSGIRRSRPSSPA